jgi:hypothetical protein
MIQKKPTTIVKEKKFKKINNTDIIKEIKKVLETVSGSDGFIVMITRIDRRAGKLIHGSFMFDFPREDIENSLTEHKKNLTKPIE